MMQHKSGKVHNNKIARSKNNPQIALNIMANIADKRFDSDAILFYAKARENNKRFARA